MDEKIPTCGKWSLVESRAKMLVYLNAVKGEGNAPGDDPLWNSTMWWAMECDVVNAAAGGEECPQETEMCPGGYLLTGRDRDERRHLQPLYFRVDL